MIQKRIIHIDNLEVAKALNVTAMDDLRVTILRRVQILLHSKSFWCICYIARNDNTITDRLAKLNLSWKSSLQILYTPPTEVLGIRQRTLDYDSSLLS